MFEKQKIRIMWLKQNKNVCHPNWLVRLNIWNNKVRSNYLLMNETVSVVHLASHGIFTALAPVECLRILGALKWPLDAVTQHDNFSGVR